MNSLDAESLIKAGRDVQVPFRLSVLRTSGAATEVTILEIFRLLPGRRLVALAETETGPVLVKVFIGRLAARYSRRESDGSESIENASVLTPKLRWQGRLQSGGGFLLAFDYLEGARNLSDVWGEADCRDTRLALVSKVIGITAKLHRQGVVQHDIHPENFLIREDKMYAIDGGGVTRHGRAPLSDARSLDNLALFFAQFQASCDDLAQSALELYCAVRGWPVKASRVPLLREKIVKKRIKLKANYIAKAFRECTRFACKRSFSRFTVCERRYDIPAMRKLLSDPDRAIIGGRLLKQGNTATVALVDGPTGPLVVKRYNIKSLSHRLQRALRKSRAWVSWANALQLEFLGIRTPKPVAMIEERFGPLRSRAFFITEYVEGLNAGGLSDLPEPEAAMSALVEMLGSLWAAGLTHGDLKADNLLLGRDGPVIIDLDAVKEHKHRAFRGKAQSRDLERFMRNWESRPDIWRQFKDLLNRL